MKYLIDLDGTLMLNTEANLDAVDFIKRLQDKSIEFLVMTNSMKSPTMIQERLNKVDIHLNLEQVMNPINIINVYLKEQHYQNPYIVGSLKEKDQVHLKHEEHQPDIILLLDFEKDNLAYDDLQKIFNHLNNNIPIITASRSPYYLNKNKKVLDTGSFVNLFESVLDINIEVFGKPSKGYFEAGVKLLNTTSDQVTIIGDDYQTDILGSKNIGCHSILIQSGKYSTGDEEKCKPSQLIRTFSDIKL